MVQSTTPTDMPITIIAIFHSMHIPPSHGIRTSVAHEQNKRWRGKQASIYAPAYTRTGTNYRRQLNKRDTPLFGLFRVASLEPSHSPLRTVKCLKNLRVQAGGRTLLDSKNAMVAPRTKVTMDIDSPVKKASQALSILEEQRYPAPRKRNCGI